VQKLVDLKGYTKMDVSVSGTIDQRTYLTKLRGFWAPLAPSWIRLWILSGLGEDPDEPKMVFLACRHPPTAISVKIT